MDGVVVVRRAVAIDVRDHNAVLSYLSPKQNYEEKHDPEHRSPRREESRDGRDGYSGSASQGNDRDDCRGDDDRDPRE